MPLTLLAFFRVIFMRLVWKEKWEVREEILLFETKNRFDRQVQVKCRLTVCTYKECGLVYVKG